MLGVEGGGGNPSRKRSTGMAGGEGEENSYVILYTINNFLNKEGGQKWEGIWGKKNKGACPGSGREPVTRSEDLPEQDTKQVHTGSSRLDPNLHGRRGAGAGRGRGGGLDPGSPASSHLHWEDI